MPGIGQYEKKLVVLVADLDAENALRGVLQRWRSMGIRQLQEDHDFEIRRHPQRDPGCRCSAKDFLEAFVRTHGHALIVFDHDGCGQEDQTAVEIEDNVERQMSDAGWQGRCAAVVIEPELEAWVWSDSPHVDEELGWKERRPALREWLRAEGCLACDTTKPSDPKTTMQRAMREANKPLSSRVFLKLAESVSISRCRDRAFDKLKTTLHGWFSSGNDGA
jgi:hypothetical protein